MQTMHFGLRFLLFLSLPAFTAAQCPSDACKGIVVQEFRSDGVVCNSGTAFSGCPAGCTWQVLDLVWCADRSVAFNSESKTFDIYSGGVSGAGTAYTNECRTFIAGGGVCRLQNIATAVHSISATDIGFSISAVALEIIHFVVIVVLKYSEVYCFLDPSIRAQLKM